MEQVTKAELGGGSLPKESMDITIYILSYFFIVYLRTFEDDIHTCPELCVLVCCHNKE